MKVKLFLFGLFIFIFSIRLQASDETLNIDSLIIKASKEKKQLLVFFHMTHCGYCKRMKNITLQDSNVQKKIKKHFLFRDININDKEKVLFQNQNYSKKKFAHSLDVDFFPTVLFFDNNGEITYTVRGHRKIKKFQKILEYIKTKSYENIDFFDYSKSEKK
ncbi:MAG: hypothetical protein CSA86_04090 [Arcobacter sp.]|nr:MAG: hypothetical protein CSA86_04090 [Arcobacter sp.]